MTMPTITSAVIAARVRALLGRSDDVRNASKLIGNSCQVFTVVLDGMDPDKSREHRAALTASSDALILAERAMGALLAHYPIRGLYVPVYPPIGIQDAAAALKQVSLLVQKEQRRLGTGAGRPREPVSRALARSIITILSNANVASTEHRKVVQECFDLMGLGNKAQGAFRAAREVEKTTPV